MGEAVLTAVYLINRLPTKALETDKTPYESWNNNKKRTIKHLKVFGSTVYVHNKTREGKFDSKSIERILVGYESNCYKVWVVETVRFIKAWDVIVDEISYKITRPPMDIKEVTTSQQICQSDLEPFNHLLAPGINNTSDVSKADKLM